MAFRLCGWAGVFSVYMENQNVLNKSNTGEVFLLLQYLVLAVGWGSETHWKLFPSFFHFQSKPQCNSSHFCSRGQWCLCSPSSLVGYWDWNNLSKCHDWVPKGGCCDLTHPLQQWALCIKPPHPQFLQWGQDLHGFPSVFPDLQTGRNLLSTAHRSTVSALGAWRDGAEAWRQRKTASGKMDTVFPGLCWTEPQPVWAVYLYIKLHGWSFTGRKGTKYLVTLSRRLLWQYLVSLYTYNKNSHNYNSSHYPSTCKVLCVVFYCKLGLLKFWYWVIPCQLSKCFHLTSSFGCKNSRSFKHSKQEKSHFSSQLSATNPALEFSGEPLWDCCRPI